MSHNTLTGGDALMKYIRNNACKYQGNFMSEKASYIFAQMAPDCMNDILRVKIHKR